MNPVTLVDSPRREQLLAAARCRHTAPMRQIMLDLDSTVFPLIETIGHHVGRPGFSPHDCETWDSLVEHLGGVPQLIQVLDEVLVYEKMMSGGVYEGAVEAVHALRDHGVRVHVVTDRPAHVFDDTRRYLLDHDLPFDELVVVPKVDKLAYCTEQQIGVVVDDHPELIRRAHRAGLDVCALRYPYNTPSLDACGLTGARDWREMGGQVFDAVERRVMAPLAQAAA